LNSSAPPKVAAADFKSAEPPESPQTPLQLELIFDELDNDFGDEHLLRQGLSD
jgi:hypothetical protein